MRKLRLLYHQRFMRKLLRKALDAAVQAPSLKRIGCVF